MVGVGSIGPACIFRVFCASMGFWPSSKCTFGVGRVYMFRESEHMV